MSRRQPSSPSSARRKGGPPPLRRQGQVTKPKPRATWREIVRAFRRPTIGRLRRDLSHYLIYGLFMFVIIFLAGALFSFDSAPKPTEEGQSFLLIGQVGNTRLTRQDFEQLQGKVGLLERGSLVYRYSQIGAMFDRWVDEQLLTRVAGERHLKVGSQDVAAKVDELLQQRIDAERGDLSEKMWRYRLQQKGSSAATVEKQYRDEILAQESDIRAELLLEKARENIQQEVKITDDDLHDKYDTVTARVVLVRANMRKPMAPPEGVTETEDEVKRRQQQEEEYKQALEQAKPKAEKLLARIKAAPNRFEAIARAESDDYSKDQGGLLSAFNRSAARFGDNFKTAVFKLEPNKISDLIATDDGWVICRVEAKQTWPDMFRTAEPRTFDEAKKLAEQVRRQLVDQHADFATVAREKSEDTGSAPSGGELGGLTERGQWVKPFEKVGFALEVNEISQPVRTQFGYHLIQCLEREPAEPGESFPADEPKTDEEKAELKDLPIPNHPDLAPARRVRIRHILFNAEDPDKKLEDKRKELTDERQSEHYNDVIKRLRDEGFKSGLIRVECPEIKAYLASKDYQQEDELFWLRRAASAWPDSHSEVHYELAQQYLRLGGFQTSQKPQVAAAQVLAGFDGAGVVGDLLRGLDSLYPEVRKAVINSLGQLKAEDAVARLRLLAETDPDAGVVEAARKAIAAIRGEKPAEGAAPKPPQAEAPPVPAEAPPQPLTKP